MQRSIILFLCWISVYFVGRTIVGYGLLDGESTAMMRTLSLLKEVVRAMICLGCALMTSQSRTAARGRIRQYRGAIALLACFVGWGIIVSLINDVPLTQMIAGIKFDVLPMCLVLSGLFIGQIHAARQGADLDDNQNNNDDITHTASDPQRSRRSRLFFWLFVGVMAVGIVVQLTKLRWPDMRYAMGFGPLGDYVPDAAPPIYYLTQLGGTMRLSGLFSGPNNYGFFLVGITTFFLMYWHQRYGWRSVIGRGVMALFGVSVVRNMGRGTYLGVIVQLGLLVRVWRKRRAMLLGIVGAIGIGIISYLKPTSTLEHIEKPLYSLHHVADSPIGHGFGSAGSGIHYGGGILPENYYLQILVDTGLLGFGIWLIWRIVLWQLAGGRRIPSQYRGGIVGLAIVGMFLHVLEDSMANYLMLVTMGILVGLWREGAMPLLKKQNLSLLER